MQFKTIVGAALLASSVGASQQAVAAANVPRQQTSPAPTASINTQSILAILASVLPTSLVNEAITNSAAVASEISSEFAAGKTPAWFYSLPSSIQQQLVPLQTLTQAPGVFLSALPAAATTLVNQTYVNLNTTTRPPYPAGNGTMGMAGSTGTVMSTTVTTSTPVILPSTTTSRSSTGGAALPTAVVGGGIAGLIGIIGVLAL